MTNDLEVDLERQLVRLAHRAPISSRSVAEIRAGVRRRRRRRGVARGTLAVLAATVVGGALVSSRHDRPEQSGSVPTTKTTTTTTTTVAVAPSDTRYLAADHPFPETAGGVILVDTSDPAVPATFPADFPAEIPLPDTFVEQVVPLTSDGTIIGWEMHDRTGRSGGAAACRRYASNFDSWPSHETLDEIRMQYAREFVGDLWSIWIGCTEDGVFIAQVIRS